MNILIATCSKKLRNGKENPKNYPWWPELLHELGMDFHVTQIAAAGDRRYAADYRVGLSMADITKLVAECAFWVSVDSFLPHLAHHLGKPGVVLWAKSDPVIYGYPENLNLLKDRKYLRKSPFDIWEHETFDSAAFMSVPAIVSAVSGWYKPRVLKAA